MGTVTEVRIDRWRTSLGLITRNSEVSDRDLLMLLTGECDRLETAISRFIPDSELSMVNQTPGRWVDVSWLFTEVLTAAIDAAAHTDGLVDPCLGEAVDAAGYRTWRDDAPAPDPDAHPGPSLGSWRGIEIRPAGSHAQVRIPPATALDLGAIGKAWLADRLADQVTARFGGDVVADMGGDLRIMAHDDPWIIGIDPGLPGIAAQKLEIRSGGLATSGTGRRTWRDARGGTAHHIIDPRTGRPARVLWSSASVLAATARGANTAATASIVLGADAPGWLESLSLDAWLVGPDVGHLAGRWPMEVAA